MKTSIDGLKEIASYEGVSTEPYLDSADVWTIGIGRTRSDGMKINKNTPKITIKQAFEWFKEDIKPYEDAVNKYIKVPLKQNEFDALVSFQYNTGAIDVNPRFGKTLPTFVKYINQGKTKKEIVDAWMKWNKITVNGKKVTSKGLTNRRAKETHLYLFSVGGYSNDGYMDLISIDSRNKPKYDKRIKIDDYI